MFSGIVPWSDTAEGENGRRRRRRLAGVRFHQLTRDRNGCLSVPCSASFLCRPANVGYISSLASLNCRCGHLPSAETKFLYTFSRTAHRLWRTTFGRDIQASLGSTSTNQHGGRRSQQVLALSIYVTIRLLGWQVAPLIASWQMWNSE